MPSKCLSAAELERLLQQEFADTDEGALHAHLAECPACRQLLDDLTSAPASRATPMPQLTPAHDAAWRAGRAGLQAALLARVHDLPSAESGAAVPVVPGYLIEYPLGEGGAGIVYRARHQKLDRPVALKMLRPGTLDLAEVRARFRREAEVLSQLRHPHIVQLFDFGEVARPGGPPTPYMVLELIDGGTLGARVDHRPLPAHTAAALIETLARALHVVHQQGVIHRDLKPGNVLLQPLLPDNPGLPLAEPGRLLDEYVPKLTDFGLAKRLIGEMSEWTHTRDVLGTPGYMAPEQAGEGKEVTTAADVYALGVILYELLTGLPPFRGHDWVELIVQVKEREPVAPSRLLPGIPRDLETICLKCLHKEPGRRYPSAEALADDCRRFLSGRAILARPAGRAEKFRKWCRRNPWVAGLSATVLLLLVVGLAVTTGLSVVAERRRGETQAALDQLKLEQERLQQEQERLQQEQGRTREALAAEKRRREQARQALEAITSEIVPDWLGRSAELTAEQRQFLTRALAQYQDFARDSATDEDSRVGVADAQLRVAQFQRSLGQFVEARRSAAQAEQSWERLVAEFPAKREYGRNLALAYWLQSVLLRGLDDKNAEKYVRRAAALNQRLLAEGQPDPKIQHQLCDCLNTLGTLLRHAGRFKEAEEQWRALLPLRQQLATRFPHSADHGIGLLWVHLNLALVLQSTGRLPEADKEIQSALAVARPLALEHPSGPRCPQWLARCHEVRAVILARLGEPNKAEAEYRAAVATMTVLYRDYPGYPDVQSYLLLLQTNLSANLYHAGKLQEAEALARAVVTIRQQLAAREGARAEDRNALAAEMVKLSQMLMQQKKQEEARRLLEEAEPHHRAALAAEPRNAAFRFWFRNNRWSLVECLLALSDHAAAARAVEEWAQTAVDAKIDPYNAASCLARCASLAGKDERLTAGQRQELGQKYDERAVDLLKQAIRNGFQDVAALRKNPALEALRQRPDVKQLLADLERRAKPASPDIP